MKPKLFLLAVMILANCNYGFAGSFIIHGRIDNTDVSKLILKYWSISSGRRVILEEQVSNGIFCFSGEIDEPVNATLVAGNDEIDFYIEPGEMEMEISGKYPRGHKVSGSTVNNDLAAWYKTHEDPECGEVILTKEKRDSIGMNFISDHPDSFVSIDKFKLVMQQRPVGIRRKFFDNMSESIKTSMAGEDVNSWIKRDEDTSVGAMAPDFSVTDMNGNTVTLSDYRDRTCVLLVFWGSTCAPCKQSFPHLKELYGKYSDRLNMIFISNDWIEENWSASIDQCDIKAWPQVLALSIGKNFYGNRDKNEICDKYPVNPVPIYLLIDRTGKIILRQIGFDQDSFLIRQIEDILDEQ